jgi:hypothetical protein
MIHIGDRPMKNIRFVKAHVSIRPMKYYCPICIEQLKVVTIANIMNTQADTGDYQSFPMEGSYMYGAVTSYSTEYQCQKCRQRYKVDDIKMW